LALSKSFVFNRTSWLLSRNNHSTFGATGWTGLHPATDFQSAHETGVRGPKSADAIGAQDAILPHLASFKKRNRQ
jgi:hypothetical protein